MMNLDAFLNISYGVIGRTASTKHEPNTSSQFHFWLAKLGASGSTGTQVGDRSKGEIAPIEIGNIVAARSDQDDDITFGLVTEMRAYSDIDSFIADYLSHNFGDATIEVPTDISEVVVVTCSVMRNVSLKTKPVGRSRVYFPSQLGIQYAYGIVDESGESVFSGAPIPIGIFENGDGTIAPVSVDEDFLIGPEGAHLNVSGISGLAAKTSAIEFVIKSLLTHSRKRVAVVMFNVKSKDLLYIDQPNTKLGEDEWSKKVYEELSIPVEAFADARFFAPADPSNRPHGSQSLRVLETEIFEWDLSMIYRDIPSLFNSMDWDDRMEGVWFIIREEIENERLLTYNQMLSWVSRQINQANDARPPRQWIRGNHIATWNKMRSHLQRFPRSYRGLIATAGEGRDIPWQELSSGSVYVIDMQMLNDRGQRLVFGRAVSTISQKLENGELDVDAVIIFVDELNKFAPSGNVRTPLKSRLIDITARGRSLGLILFGAEQFASSVDKEIVENSSTYLFGRTETNELRAPNYAAFSDEIKAKLTMLSQGRLLVKFAKFPQPIFVRFPYPPCLPGDMFNAAT
ncbi:MAG: ATP-binding protein [Gammaproteobacteria bacterium]|nr:ATP-binding protein [Gammaproteobacteria bacterium]